MIVIKVGGSRGINYDAVCADLAELYRRGEKFVLVHGGSYETNVISEKLGRPPQFITSASGYESRFTDRETLEIFEMVYCGKMNTSIVEKLQALGVKAIGLSGVDGRLWEGVRKASVKVIENGKRRILHGDYTGKVEKVNTELIHLLTNAGYVLALSPPAISYESEAINVDGDRAAAKVAEALQADQLIILSNVPGLLRDVKDESSLVPRIARADLDTYMVLAQGRMKKKIMAAGEALAAGVRQVVLGDARIDQPILHAFAGQGTVIV